MADDLEFDERLFSDVASEKEANELAQRLVGPILDTAGNAPQYLFAYALIQATAALVKQTAKPGQQEAMLKVAANYFTMKAEEVRPAVTN